jgi:hypothetical protein
MTKIGKFKVIFTLDKTIDINLLINKLIEYEKIVPIDYVKDIKIRDIYKFISECIR